MFGIAFPGGTDPVTGAFGSAQEFSAGSGAPAWGFSGMSFGTAASNRVVVACIGYGSSFSISSATIGGVGATLLFTQNNSNSKLFICSALVPTGTSGTVQTNQGSTGIIYCSTYSVYGGTLATSLSTIVNPFTETINIAAGSFAISMVFGLGTTSYTGLTLDNNNNVGGTTLGVASKAFATSQTSYTITGSQTSGVKSGGLLVYSP